MNRNLSLLIIFIIWITTISQCNSVALSTEIICSGTRIPCGTNSCYDPATETCPKTSSRVACIDGICNGTCYNAASNVCINNTLCAIGHDVCDVKFNISGAPIQSPGPYCYNVQSQRCLNHTICNSKRVCNGQCMLYTNDYQYNRQVCANDNKTLCNVSDPYTNYKRNQIQLCNGTCYDTENGLKHCVDGSPQCIFNCFNVCYNPMNQTCISGELCRIGFEVCEKESSRQCYDPSYYKCLNGEICSIGFELCEKGSSRQCYDPSRNKCLNGTICANNRACGERCITNSYQVCASDRKTICNVSKVYTSYTANQIRLCQGVCYDSSVQQCPGEHIIPCIHDPETQECVPQNITSSTTTRVANSTSTISPSTSSTLTAPLTSPKDFLRESFSYETATITTTVWTAPMDSFTHSSISKSPSTLASIESNSNNSISSVDMLSTSTYSSQNFTSNSSLDDTKFPSVFSSSSSVSATIEEDSDDSMASTEYSSLYSSSLSEDTGVPSMSLSSSSTSATIGGDSDDSMASTDTLSPSTHSSNSFILTAESSSKETNIASTFSGSSWTSTTNRTVTGTSITSSDMPSSRLSHSSNSFTFTTEPSFQTTNSFIPTNSPEDGCYVTKECTNETDCCTPRVENRCHRYSRASDDGQTCKTIILGKNENSSFVAAIALNNGKVIVINRKHLFILILSITMTWLLLLLITMSFVAITHRKIIAIILRIGYHSARAYMTTSERKEWEKYQKS